jgi:hypothetical protein
MNQIIQNSMIAQTKQFDNEIFKALKKHGYEVNYSNMHEFARIHTMEQTIHDGLHTLWVDGKGICIWTDWKVEPFDFSRDEYKINSYFKFKVL